MNDLPGNKLDAPEPGKEEFGCAGCIQEDKCREVWSMKNRGPFNSTGLVLASISVFLLPIVTAITAGWLVQAYAASAEVPALWQATAVVGGLGGGVFLAWLIVPLIRKKFHAPDVEENYCRD